VRLQSSITCTAIYEQTDGSIPRTLLELNEDTAISQLQQAPKQDLVTYSSRYLQRLSKTHGHHGLITLDLWGLKESPHDCLEQLVRNGRLGRESQSALDVLWSWWVTQTTGTNSQGRLDLINAHPLRIF